MRKKKFSQRGEGIPGVKHRVQKHGSQKQPYLPRADNGSICEAVSLEPALGARRGVC